MYFIIFHTPCNRHSRYGVIHRAKKVEDSARQLACKYFQILSNIFLEQSRLRIVQDRLQKGNGRQLSGKPIGPYMTTKHNHQTINQVYNYIKHMYFSCVRPQNTQKPVQNCSRMAIFVPMRGQSVTFLVSKPVWKPKCQSQECNIFGFETNMSFSDCGILK